MEERTKHESTAVTQPEGNGAGRTFTQEEVNRIVSDRLQKERTRAAAEPSQQEAMARQEAALKARENRLACLEFLQSRGLPIQLLEILDTADAGEFQRRAQMLLELCPSLDTQAPPPPSFSLETQGRRDEFYRDPFAAAFGRG